MIMQGSPEKSYIQCLKELSASAIYRGLLLKGFFAEKLPPIFTSEHFFKYCTSNNIVRCKKPVESQYVTFENVGHNNVPRMLGIPAPFAYERLCHCIEDNWAKICIHFKGKTAGQPYKISRIHVRKLKNDDAIFNMSYKTSEDRALSPVHRIKIGKRYKVESDISQCFHSIYTHSIPWAIVTKGAAKSDRSSVRWYNQLDKEIQANKYGETNGLLIGPHASNIISEIILVCVDEELRKANFDFVRCIDDYECYVETRERAEEFIVELTTQLKNFNLNINRKKTRIVELPTNDDGDWTRVLRNYLSNLTGDRWNSSQVSAYWDKVIELHSVENDSAVLLYALKLASKIDFNEDARVFYVNQVLQLTALRPYLFPKLDECLFDPLNVPVGQIREFSDEMYRIGRASRLYELLSFSMYYAVRYGFSLKDYDAEYICKTGDVIAITLGNYYARSFSRDEKPYRAFIKGCLKDKDPTLPIFNQNWLPCYEFSSLGQLRGKGDYAKLKTAGVSFIRPLNEVKVCWDERWERRFVNWGYSWDGMIAGSVLKLARKDFKKTRPGEKDLAQFIPYCVCLLANLYLGLLENKNITIPKALLSEGRDGLLDNEGGVLNVDLITWIIRWFKVNCYIGERCGEEGCFATFYWVKDKLRREFAQGCTTGFAYLKNANPVVSNCVEVSVRNSRRQEVSRAIGDVGMRYAAVIKASNAVNAKHVFSCMPIEDLGRIIFKPQMRSIFNLSSTKYGGRLYPGRDYRGVDYQNIHSESRSTIQIDGKNTVEIDYSGLHINILYAKEGEQCPPDPYACFGDAMRPVAKLAVLIMLNAKRNRSVMHQLKLRKKDLEGNTGLSKKSAALLASLQLVQDWESFVKDVEDRFDPIKKYFYNDAGRWLQREDSELAISILDYFGKEGIPVLSMHDSFIIEEQYSEDLKRVMQKAYSDKYPGFSITVHS